MTYTFRQQEENSATASTPLSVTLSSAPLDGSAILAAVGCVGNNAGVTKIEQDGAEWHLLEDSIEADAVNSNQARAQVWGAFNVSGAGKTVTVTFSGGTTQHGAIVVEYTGDVFQFPNPADRVAVNTGTSPSGVPGSITAGPTSTTRENGELWFGSVCTDQIVTFSGLAAPFDAYSAIDVPKVGPVGKLTAVAARNASAAAMSFSINHSSPGSAMDWAVAVAAVRGNIQQVSDPVDEPVAAEPVTEFDDYSGDAIGKLASQFRAKT